MKTFTPAALQLLNSAESTQGLHSAGAFDAGKISDTIKRALASAGLDTQSGPMKTVTDTIEQALSGAGLKQHPAPPVAQPGEIIEGVARDVTLESEIVVQDEKQAPLRRTGGQFLNRSFSNAAGTRAYRLYVPASYSEAGAEAVPAIMMLHGCTQSPEDFAVGTQMNALSEEHGFLVIYPAQPSGANPSKCWNWFNATDQVRGRGEPSLLAGIARAVADDYRVDPGRTYVAGMSAGAAMAVVLGETYPDLFAAVGAHSGLAYGAAHDVPSAMAAMQGGSVLRTNPPLTPASSRADRAQRDRALPTIVFHGDRDTTVNVRNGNAIVEHARSADYGDGALRATVDAGVSRGGRACRRTTYADAAGQSIVEYWMITGAGHTWSGGNPAGSYTDARGPDASAEMVRFFLSHRLPSNR